jgi:hypothetical protein
MLIWIFLDAFFRKVDVATRSLPPAEPLKVRVKSIERLSSKRRNIRKGGIHDHDRYR